MPHPRSCKGDCAPGGTPDGWAAVLECRNEHHCRGRLRAGPLARRGPSACASPTYPGPGCSPSSPSTRHAVPPPGPFRRPRAGGCVAHRTLLRGGTGRRRRHRGAAVRAGHPGRRRLFPPNPVALSPDERGLPPFPNDVAAERVIPQKGTAVPGARAGGKLTLASPKRQLPSQSAPCLTPCLTAWTTRSQTWVCPRIRLLVSWSSEGRAKRPPDWRPLRRSGTADGAERHANPRSGPRNSAGLPKASY